MEAADYKISKVTTWGYDKFLLYSPDELLGKFNTRKGAVTFRNNLLK